MSEGADPRNPMLPALEGLAAVEAAATVEAALRAAVEVACLATASPRGLAGLTDGEAVTAGEWFDADRGWTGTPLRWVLGEGAPGRVCESATPLACNDLPGTVECLPEATGVLHLTRFACVPIAGEAGTLGFLEVGNRASDYTADEVRCLRAIAGRAAHRLQALAAEERRDAEQRLCAEALLGGRELFSLDPEVVLREATRRARELTGAADVVALRLDGPARADTSGLHKEERAALEEATRARAPAAAGARALVASSSAARSSLWSPLVSARAGPSRRRATTSAAPVSSRARRVASRSTTSGSREKSSRPPSSASAQSRCSASRRSSAASACSLCAARPAMARRQRTSSAV